MIFTHKAASPPDKDGTEKSPVKYNYADTIWCTYIVSVIAASIAEMFTYPLDLTKTRLQIQGEGGTILKTKYRGMLATAGGIIREEGILKLWQGITPALYRHCVYSGVRIVAYDAMRTKLRGDKELTLWQSAVAGVGAGMVAQWLASPADLVKVQIQMEGKRRLLGQEPRVHGTHHAFREIVKRGGIPGLWKGSIPNVQRAALVNLGDLTTYDVAKRFVMKKTGLPDSHLVHIIASMCAGFAAAAMGTPADVIKTRVMNQPTDLSGKGLLYKGSVDCLQKTVSREGFFALYKGFLPVWIRLGPWALIFWVSFEHIRATLGATGY
ncbi:mitochondrial uncoupling protein 4-like [Uranotaenia lowii]|uniref:mitochondrial uncoupling protein 4-like n=1 Tax=Uranotaenia lowii TaxID=190385 RepID=UPI00247863F4|nr:mitochondrial uncoupling protein 4-like [Uranotaenia lowii]